MYFICTTCNGELDEQLRCKLCAPKPPKTKRFWYVTYTWTGANGRGNGVGTVNTEENWLPIGKTVTDFRNRMPEAETLVLQSWRRISEAQYLEFYAWANPPTPNPHAEQLRDGFYPVPVWDL